MFKKGKKSRNELLLPALRYIVSDDWIDKLGHDAFIAWLKFHTWVDREDANREYDKIPYTLEATWKKLGMGKKKFYEKVIRPLWNYYLIDIVEYDDSKRKSQKPKNIIVYESPMNQHETEIKPLEKLRDYDTEYGSPSQLFGRKGGRPTSDSSDQLKMEIDVDSEVEMESNHRFQMETVTVSKWKPSTVSKWKPSTVSKWKPNNYTNNHTNEPNKHNNDSNNLNNDTNKQQRPNNIDSNDIKRVSKEDQKEVVVVSLSNSVLISIQKKWKEYWNQDLSESQIKSLWNGVNEALQKGNDEVSLKDRIFEVMKYIYTKYPISNIKTSPYKLVTRAIMENWEIWIPEEDEEKQEEKSPVRRSSTYANSHFNKNKSTDSISTKAISEEDIRKKIEEMKINRETSSHLMKQELERLKDELSKEQSSSFPNYTLIGSLERQIEALEKKLYQNT
ncbi:hypothetical protein [Thermoflavimicrobium daqui]|uniref:Uncharacterized protein n=1 Tax=Thermoflavimicrobium daqui TaxID=2137476 RepID=A0A364K1L1_9BACL|nr:hypothetical protein [Thermoflavimicrobium daqui]RAL21920.1 hypothetical protein DL897_15120 [Thermoflavimicrobium daqui]